MRSDDQKLPGPLRAVTFRPVGPELPVRVVLDPMPTILTSLVEWFGPLRARVPSPIRRQAAALARNLDLRPLAVMVTDPFGHGPPDFLTRINHDLEVPTIRDSTEILAAEPSDTVLKDLDQTFGSAAPQVRSATAIWHRDERRARAVLCRTLDRYWYGVVLPVYPDAERRLTAAAQQLRQAIAAVGPQAAVASLHPKVQLSLSGASSVRLSPAGVQRDQIRVRELTIKPMIANRRTVLTNVGWEPTRAAFGLPTPGLAATAARPSNAGSLTLLLGPARADLLQRISTRAATVTTLAEATGLAPSTICHHLAVLTEADVLTKDREGARVLYSLTERGHRLLSV
jgi:DNA-binding transcriptional ArsR family regulator